MGGLSQTRASGSKKPQTNCRPGSPQHRAVALSRRVEDSVLFCMCFVLRINKQNKKKFSKQRSQLFLLPSEHIPKQSEKKSPNLCSRSLFFLTSLLHLHLLLRFSGFHPLGPCKTKLLPWGLCCASAAVCSGHREEEEGHGVCRRFVFPASHSSSSSGALWPATRAKGL